MLAIFALLFATWRFRGPIIDLVSSTNPWLLGASVIFAFLANYLTGLPFRHFVEQVGIKLPWPTACYLQLVAQVTKYIPGNIWGAILQAQLVGSSRAGSLFLAGMEVTLFFLITVTTTGLALLAYCRSPLLGVLICVCGWSGAAIIASSSWATKTILRMAKLFAGRSFLAPSSSPPGAVARLFVLAALHSAVMLLSFFCMLAATTPYRHEQLIISVASICLAWVAGTLAIFVPSGIGVREAAFVYIAAQFDLSTDIRLLTAVSIVARVAQTLPDLLAAIVVSVAEANTALRNPKGRNHH